MYPTAYHGDAPAYAATLDGHMAYGVPTEALRNNRPTAATEAFVVRYQAVLRGKATGIATGLFGPRMR